MAPQFSPRLKLITAIREDPIGRSDMLSWEEPHNKTWKLLEDCNKKEMACVRPLLKGIVALLGKCGGKPEQV